MEKIRVAINGYGVIGRRVADAVALQEDMELAGIADIVNDYRVRVAALHNYPVYAAVADRAAEMRDVGINVQDALDDLLKRVDVVVDCTPKGIDAQNKSRYEQAGVKAIFQGGAKHELTGHSFVASANYESALGRNSTRVVSCNTTATVRTLMALRNAGLLVRAWRAHPPRRRSVGEPSRWHHQHNRAGEEDSQPSRAGRQNSSSRSGRGYDGG